LKTIRTPTQLVKWTDPVRLATLPRIGPASVSSSLEALSRAPEPGAFVSEKHVMSDETRKQVGDLTITIDRDLCIGSGNCVKVEPHLFQLDDEGIAAFASGAENVDRGRVVDACEVCPVEALTVRDRNGDQLVP
jgi:ferredoxin